jgi:Zn-dependent protease
MVSCPQCGTQMPAGIVICPACNALIHRAELERLSAEATELTNAGNLHAAREVWKKALLLLPAASRQYQGISGKISAINLKIPEKKKSDKQPADGGGAKKTGIIMAVALFFWKFKVIFAFILTKAKFLILGLTKVSTFFSLFLSIGVYWTLFGWQLAVGFLLCIYVHEMGHVYALGRYGIKASAPMFIPGFGAYVRLHEQPPSAVENAHVGLAGPLWGLGATLACLLLHTITQQEIFAALTRLSGWVNLFNLLPVWQLDGNRGFSALARIHRFLLAGVAAAAFVKDAPANSDRRTLYLFSALVLALALLSAVEVNTSRASDAGTKVSG